MPAVRHGGFLQPGSSAENNLEHNAFRITLTIVRNMKLAIALILGLAFQLAQVMPVAAALSSSCHAVAKSCCCSDSQSCPCMDEGEPTQKPSPAPIHSGNEVKIPAMKSTDTLVSVRSSRQIPSVATVEIPSPTEPFVGFTGVRLSVAFCSFVI